ncbi:MAG: pyruvate:ferredoxin (flavodoxin) oxidoreductase [Clostridiales bacterium]|nr:pyruvate:ferredoxin (flavodoxin) oxidoreductase [Clostridiales bacterium]
MGKKMKTMDGNTAAAHIAYAFTDVAAIYPITPSSVMAENVDEWAAYGRKNIFGQEVSVVEMQSEGGAAGALHGSLAAGALTTTFTASQGLLLMIPNMYKIAGELLPAVMHVSARTISTHALNIFGDHSDVMSTRQTGFAMLASGSVQEVMDLAGVAHMAAIKSRVPFLHFFDGFRTSHEIQKIEVIEYDDLAKMVDMDAVQAFRDNALTPERPVTRGTAQNPDIYFQARESSNRFYDSVPDIVEEYMKKIGKLTGRKYKPFDYYGHPKAEYVIVAMGSVTETIEETIDTLMEQGEKVGLVKVRLYRPFSAKHLLKVVPKSVKKIAVLDRTKEPGSPGEPLYLDVKSVFYGQKKAPVIVGGRYGLGSKDTTPQQILAVYKNIMSDSPKDRFTIGINDDVTYTSLDCSTPIKTAPEDRIRCKFWGLGSDGTVGANKSAIKIIGDNTDLYAQGYFAYDSKKSGGLTVSHLRFGKDPIKSTYLIEEAEFVACHHQAYIKEYDVLEGLKPGGTFVLNCIWTPEELNDNLPGKVKRYLAQNDINFYIINATNIGREIGLGNRINMIMQSAFFKLADVIPVEDAITYLKDAVITSYGKKGEKIINMNFAAIERGASGLVKIDLPEEWKDAPDDEEVKLEVPEFIENIMMPMLKQQGDKLPVSSFVGREDGTFPPGTSAYEKRGIAITVPKWDPEECIQCNQCSFVCPHAAIRPFLLDDDELAKAPEAFRTNKAFGKGLDKLHFRVETSPLDCTGCGNCVDICPAKNKALSMVPIMQEEATEYLWDFAMTVKPKDHLVNKKTVRGSQFAQPLIEFSGACAGCGETPYIKAITQLYGERMMIANATGCSSIWGASAPSMPYTTNHEGRGPAWANSLFEDNAEFGLGMAVASRQIREKICELADQLVKMQIPNELKVALKVWSAVRDEGDGSVEPSRKLAKVLEDYPVADPEARAIAEEIMKRKDYLVKKSFWILGGDGWAYDIGYGGLDHILASGENVNILVFDTEVYSNTGGQASKATPAAAVAKFAASGKKIKKKDLGLIAMTYGYVYVAQVGMGSDYNQFIKAVTEAELYDGPSIIIAYAPCINHGLKKGMNKAQENIRDAVDCGYWHLYRFNPSLKEQGKHPFILDSKEPSESFRDFILNQVRYSSLKTEFPDKANEMFSLAERNARERYETYVKLLEGQFL